MMLGVEVDESKQKQYRGWNMGVVVGKYLYSYITFLPHTPT